jgi:threonylcarbamoyladenosine tRNA methylthiotransferase CDKAL1
MKFYIETYGCTANFGNSEDAIDALKVMGHIQSSLDKADIVIVNTCAVTQKTERRILGRLRYLQGERLVIAGCLYAALPESISEIRCRERLGLLNRSSAKRFAHQFEDIVKPFSPDSLDCISNTSNFDRNHLCGIINISEGCNGHCNYCIVRKARGKLVSQRPEEILFSVKNLANSGIAEIQLAAQDIAAYGLDIGTTLPELLENVTKVPGKFKVRLGMMNPDSLLAIKEGLINALRSPKIYRFLHIPSQSGSNEILKSMGRRYSREDFLEIVEAFRSAYPEITIVTDVIVGFPGETEENFLETMMFIRCLQPDKVNVTRFSSRPGTAAANLYDMPDRIKKERSRKVTRLWLEIAATKNRRYVGRVLDASVTECGKGATMKARTANYTGIVISGAPDLGSLCQIRITEANPFYLKGILQL